MDWRLPLSAAAITLGWVAMLRGGAGLRPHRPPWSPFRLPGGRGEPHQL
jgi:hypothetical protein